MGLSQSLPFLTPKTLSTLHTRYFCFCQTFSTSGSLLLCVLYLQQSPVCSHITSHLINHVAAQMFTLYLKRVPLSNLCQFITLLTAAILCYLSLLYTIMDTPHFLQLFYLYCFLKLTYKLPSSIRLKHSKNGDLLFTAISQMPRRITGLKNLITNAQMDCFYCCLAWWSGRFLTLERIRADWVSLHQRWISALHGGTSHTSMMQGTCDMPTTSKSQQPWMWFLFFSHLPKGNFFQFHTFGSGRFLIKDTL